MRSRNRYTIKSVRVRNFKGFDDRKFYLYDIKSKKNPVILSGPNGFGKTTFFDAVELSLAKNITRFYPGVDKANTDIGSNVFLNDPLIDGYIILVLESDEGFVTIYTKIDKNIRRITYSNSISQKISVGEYNEEEMSYEELKNLDYNYNSDIKEMKIDFNVELFNLFHYVSQEETAHFLKYRTDERISELSILLNTTEIQNKINRLSNLSSRAASKEINVRLESIEKDIKIKKEDYKRALKAANSDLLKVEYEKLLNYKEGMLEWDKDFINNEVPTSIQLNELEKELTALHFFYKNKSDWDLFKINHEIISVSKNSRLLNKIINLHTYINKNLTFDLIRIKNRISEIKMQLSILSYGKTLIEDFEIKELKTDDLKELKKLYPSLVTMELVELEKYIGHYNELYIELEKKDKFNNTLIGLREKIFELTLDLESKNCPYCNHTHISHETLLEGYEDALSLLQSNKTSKYEELEKISSRIKEFVEFDRANLLNLKEKNSLSDKQLREEKDMLSQILESEEEKSRILDVYKNIRIEINDKTTVSMLEESYRKNTGTYTNPQFLELIDKYNFERISKKYSRILEEQQSRIIELDKIDNKIRYIEYYQNENNNEKLVSLEFELRKLFFSRAELMKLKSISKNLGDLYTKVLSIYSSQVLDHIKVPLLIYTSKLLQDYQGGLGVFIDDSGRFVSKKDGHDILNTLSSGQLSAFVIAFTLTMNKLYADTNENGLDFLLIDDPVQTMDDINITSLIEVLRNDFFDKQLIISTHEEENEYYFLYKFMKYNIMGQSLNVKDSLLQELITK